MAKKLLSPIAFLSATAFLAGSLSAQTTYSDQQTFDDGLLSSYTENFSDFSPEDDNDFDTFENDSETYTDSVFSFTATTASADGTESPAQVDLGGGNFVNSAIWYVGGDGYPGTALSVLDTGVRLRFTDFTTAGFPGVVDSFGGRFFLTESSGTIGADDVTAGTLDIVVTFDNGSVETYSDAVTSPSPGGALEFFGVIAEQGLAITQVDLISNDSNLVPTAGFVTVGTAIPEPATVVFWSGVGVFALVVAWRRRKQAA